MTDSRLKGTVSARKCPCCGHHEIGITDNQGDFTPLQPGMGIEITSTEGMSDSPEDSPPTPPGPRP